MKLDGESRAARGPGWEERRDHRAEARSRWRGRSAQWAALALAHHLFGPSATVRSAGGGAIAPSPSDPVQGMLQLRVPFRSLEDHRQRESRFLALTRMDPVLASFPFLYVFEPDPSVDPPPGPPASWAKPETQPPGPAPEQERTSEFRGRHRLPASAPPEDA